MNLERIGISVHISKPLAASLGDQQIDITNRLTQYQHTISTFGGYDKAEISFSAQAYELNDWIANGVARHVECYGPGLEKIWEGFVNEVVIAYGTIRITRGPLSTVCNRCSAVYEPVDASTDPPTLGDTLPTFAADDADSQARYGVIEKIISVGQQTQTDAEQYRDMYLKEHKWPETGKELNLGSSELSITLRCLGYYQYLDFYAYTNLAVTGYVTVTERIVAILGDDPNSIFSTNEAQITDNGILVPAYEGDLPTALTAIKELVALGDINDTRYSFGLYDDRRIAYLPVNETEYAYYYSLFDNRQIIQTPGGSEVSPWDVRAGVWMQAQDSLIGQSDITTIQDDPRSIFIESITFDAPSTIRIQHSKSSALEQRLSRLKGISA